MSRLAWMALATVVACTGNETAAPKAPLVVPSVTSEAVLAVDFKQPPVVLVVDDGGTVSTTGFASSDEEPIGAATTGMTGALARVPPRPDDDVPRRAAAVGGEIRGDGTLDPLRALLLVPAKLPASRVVEIVAATSSAIGVSYAGTIRPLRIQFVGSRDRVATPVHWVEARVSTTGVMIEAVPETPVVLATLEPQRLGTVIANARRRRDLEAQVSVDVIVDDDVDAQRLVDVLVALDIAGVRQIGLGTALAPEDLRLRGNRTPYVMFEQPLWQGDLDVAEIRRVVTGARAEILRCYAFALARDLAVGGTLRVMFLIKTDGTVTSVTATGVSYEVAVCVERVIRPLVFEKPDHGLVQVLYPMVMDS